MEKEIKRKQLILISVGAIVVITIIIFGSAKLMAPAQKQAAPSELGTLGGNAEKITPDQVSPSYRDQMRAYNEQQAIEANRKGTSSLPPLVPREMPTTQSAATAPQMPQTPEPRQQQQSGQDNSQNDAYRAKMDAMRGMVAALIQRPQPTHQLITAQNETPAVSPAGITANAVKPASPATSVQPAAASAGDTLFASLDTEINTDAPDDVRLTVISGPLKGAILLATAKREGDFVKAVVNTMFFNKQTYDVTARVVDIDTARGLLSGTVDRKYFERFGLPFLAGLAGGLGAAISQGNTQYNATGVSTSINTSPLNSRQITGAAIGAGATAVTRQFQEQGRNTEPKVVIPANIPVGVFLLSDAVPKNGSESRAAQLANAPPTANAPQNIQASNPITNFNNIMAGMNNVTGASPMPRIPVPGSGLTTPQETQRLIGSY